MKSFQCEEDLQLHDRCYGGENLKHFEPDSGCEAVYVRFCQYLRLVYHRFCRLVQKSSRRMDALQTRRYWTGQLDGVGHHHLQHLQHHHIQHLRDHLCHHHHLKVIAMKDMQMRSILKMVKSSVAEWDSCKCPPIK